MKKSLIALIASVLIIGNVSAGEDEKIHIEPGYKTAIIDESLNFQAKKNENEVYLEWNEYQGDNFQYYKIMRSETHNNPVYPDHSALNYSDDIKNTEYKGTDWAQKTVYYRVCVITTDKARICSNVVKLEGYVHKKKDYIKEKEMNCIQVIQPAYNYKTGECKNFSTPCSVPSGWKKVTSCNDVKDNYQNYEAKKVYTKEKLQSVKKHNLNSKLAARADKMVDNLVARLDKKHGDDTDKKAERLETIIKKLETLNAKIKSEQTKALITYISEGLKEALNEMGASDDIEEIFNILEEE